MATIRKESSGTTSRSGIALEGERFDTVERVIVATEDGRFHPLEAQVVGNVVTDGDTVGFLLQRRDSRPVVSPFTGRIVEMLVHPGEQVRYGEPIAWLRVS